MVGTNGTAGTRAFASVAAKARLQAQYSRHPLPDDVDGLGRTCDWPVAELDRPLTVRHLARHAGMATRTFARVFREQVGVTPMAWLVEQRILEAQRLLEATDLLVEDVAAAAGSVPR
jgi:transcriptional regulator GlxA family with amidase domain